MTAKPNQPAPTGDPVYYTGTGYGVEPCPGCGGPLEPGQERVTEPGVWRPHHADCLGASPCTYCEVVHPLPHDGSCLL